jgi:hypothetical protein
MNIRTGNLRRKRRLRREAVAGCFRGYPSFAALLRQRRRDGNTYFVNLHPTVADACNRLIRHGTPSLLDQMNIS